MKMSFITLEFMLIIQFLDFISLSPTQRELDEKLEQLRVINTNKIGIYNKEEMLELIQKRI